MIYLATPYSHPDPEVRQQRYAAALNAVEFLHRNNIHAFSPIVYSHQLAHLGANWETWADWDKDMISRCDRLAVLKLPGWQESKGVTAEVLYALALDKPVIYVEPDELLCLIRSSD